MPVSWDAVLFDLDGTLIDSVPLILDSFHHSFTTCGLAAPSAEELLGGVGIPLEPHFSRYVSDDALVRRLVTTYREFNLANHDGRICAFPGIAAMLDQLQSSGVQLGIVTSKNRATTRRGLEITGLGGRFDVIVACDDIRHPKPHPEPVIRAVERLGVEAGRTVFVGDSLHDLYSGRAAGVRTAAVLWGACSRADLAPGEPDFWVETPDALPRAIAMGTGSR